MQVNRLYSLLACAWLSSSLVAGAALPEPEPVAVPETSALEKREDNGAYCWKFQYAGGNTVYYRLATWGPWDQDWGQGFLYNLRFKCWKSGGNVEAWAFGYEQGPPPTNGWATFEFNSLGVWDSHCVEDSVWVASNAAGQAIWNMNCNPSSNWWRPG